MNKDEPAELERLPSFATKSIWNAISAVTLIRDCLHTKPIQYLGAYCGRVASEFASWRAEPTVHRRFVPYAPEVIYSASLVEECRTPRPPVQVQITIL